MCCWACAWLISVYVYRTVVSWRLTHLHVGVGVVQHRVEELPVAEVGEPEARDDGGEPPGVVLLGADGVVAGCDCDVMGWREWRLG